MPRGTIPSDPAGRSLVIVGCGDSGRRLARRWRAAGGGEVLGLRRDVSAIEALRDPGIRGVSLDLDSADVASAVPADFCRGGVLVWLAPPPSHPQAQSQGRDDTRLACLPALLDTLQPERLLLASTTGVYGPGNRGGWTSEDAPLQPDVDRAHRRVAAERRAVAASVAAGVPLCRLRIAAIYGPGRLPISRLKAGQPLSPEMAARPGNRIHVTDLVEALFLAALHGADGGVYNVADGHPAPFGDYLDACADALGLPRLPREAGARADPAADFLRAGRRIRADRIRRELGLVLRYPDYRRGIEASLSAESD